MGSHIRGARPVWTGELSVWSEGIKYGIPLSLWLVFYASHHTRCLGILLSLKICEDRHTLSMLKVFLYYQCSLVAGTFQWSLSLWDILTRGHPLIGRDFLRTVSYIRKGHLSCGDAFSVILSGPLKTDFLSSQCTLKFYCKFIVHACISVVCNHLFNFFLINYMYLLLNLYWKHFEGLPAQTNKLLVHRYTKYYVNFIICLGYRFILVGVSSEMNHLFLFICMYHCNYYIFVSENKLPTYTYNYFFSLKIWETKNLIANTKYAVNIWVNTIFNACMFTDDM